MLNIDLIFSHSICLLYLYYFSCRKEIEKLAMHLIEDPHSYSVDDLLQVSDLYLYNIVSFSIHFLDTHNKETLQSKDITCIKCVCVSGYSCSFVHVHLFMFMCSCSCTFARGSERVCMPVRVRVHVHLYVGAWVYIFHTFTRTSCTPCTPCTHAMHIHMHIHMYKHHT